jgi:D-alanyl-D-alanine carboxypeptidase (penicillin-binding protein 5/6)
MSQRKTWQPAFIVWLMILLTAVGLAAPTVQAASNAPDIPIAARSGVVFDLTSGKILAAKDDKTAYPLASLTKIMSLYLIREAISHGRLQWDETVTPNAAEIKLSQDTALSNVPLASKPYTVKELYDAGWIYSANVAVMLLGNKLAGSQKAFIQEMQNHLHEWGIRDAAIYTTSGLNNSLIPESLRVADTPADGENKMSAADIGVVVRHLLTDYPAVLQDTAVVHRNFAVTATQNFAMTNWNALLTGNSLAQSDLPIDGLKTGTSDLAGQCLVATMPWRGRRLVSVVMHADGAATDNNKRFTATATLLRTVVQQWQPVTLTAKNTQSQRVKVTDGKQATVPLQLSQSVVGWQRNGILVTPVAAVPKKLSLTAPVTKGKQVASISLQNDALGYLPGVKHANVSLAPTKNVAELNVIERFFAWLGQLF